VNPPLRRITATRARRAFASILDQVELGGRFLVRRRGRDVCLMAPVEADRRTASECLALLRGRERVELDDRFGADLATMLATQPPEDEAP